MRGGFDKQQRVYLVEIGRARLKHIVLADSALAAEIAANLDHVAATGIFPRLLARHRNELWVEYVDGRLLTRDAPPQPEHMAEVFAALYALDASHSALEDTGFLSRALEDLTFLERGSLVSAQAAARLAERLRSSAPPDVWIGTDYGDMRAGNLVTDRNGRLRVIDVESIRRRTLLGSGVVRALERWPALDRDALVRGLDQRGVVPFWSYFPFLELASVCARAKRSLLLGKRRSLDPAALERLSRIS